MIREKEEGKKEGRKGGREGGRKGGREERREGGREREKKGNVYNLGGIKKVVEGVSRVNYTK